MTTESTAYENRGLPRMAGRLPWLLLLLAASLLALIVFLVGALIFPAEHSGEESVVTHQAGVSQLIYPASLAGEIAQLVNDEWKLPAAAVREGNAYFVVDTGDNRVVKVNGDGHIIASVDDASSSKFALKQPMAIASDRTRIVVANSRLAELVVMDLDLSAAGAQVISLTAGAGEQAPRPIGVALTHDGGYVVSDADNHRVLRLDEAGKVVWTAGTGTRAGGEDGFNVPGAVTIDQAGNSYVVDVLNGRVVKLSPEGAFVRQYGQLGDAAGTLSRPKGVAVDGEGRVFVSDGLLAAVQVFGPDGNYLGLIGRSHPSDPDSTSLFQAPAGLTISGDQLLVTDRFSGLLTFDLPAGASPEPQSE